jgi:hypothetical protein
MSESKVLNFPLCDASEAVRCFMEPEIVRQKQAVTDLEAWQARQNGSLARIEAKVDALIVRVEDRMGGFQHAIIGVLSTLAVGELGWIVMLLRR